MPGQDTDTREYGAGVVTGLHAASLPEAPALFGPAVLGALRAQWEAGVRSGEVAAEARLRPQLYELGSEADRAGRELERLLGQVELVIGRLAARSGAAKSTIKAERDFVLEAAVWLLNVRDAFSPSMSTEPDGVHGELLRLAGEAESPGVVR